MIGHSDHKVGKSVHLNDRGGPINIPIERVMRDTLIRILKKEFLMFDFITKTRGLTLSA